LSTEGSSPVRSEQTYSWIEEASADPEKHPGVDGQRETEGQTDVEQLGRVWSDGNRRSAFTLCLSICDLCSREGKEEEEEGAGELAGHGNEMVPEAVRHEADERQPFAMTLGSANVHDCWSI